jgi:hypothetical protein
MVDHKSSFWSGRFCFLRGRHNPRIATFGDIHVTYVRQDSHSMIKISRVQFKHILISKRQGIAQVQHREWTCLEVGMSDVKVGSLAKGTRPSVVCSPVLGVFPLLIPFPETETAIE